MRKFKYVGPDTESTHFGPLKSGDIVEQDTQNDTPDGGIPSAYWEEVIG